MKYYLKSISTAGEIIEKEISDEELSAFKKAKETLSYLYDLTENYRVVLESYKAVEQAKYGVELDHILYSQFGYINVTDVRVILQTPIVGYFASARYFLDSTDKILPKLLQHKEKRAFNKFRSEIYDNVKEYRFIEALRNYVQHREMPVHNVTYNHYVEDKNEIDTSDLAFTISLTADRKILKKDKKFKKAALKGIPETVDIIYCIRFHMEGIWSLFNYLVQKHFHIGDGKRVIIEQVIQDLGLIENEILEMSVLTKDDKNRISDSFPLTLHLDNSRRSALTKTGILSNLHKRYITGKIRKT